MNKNCHFKTNDQGHKQLCIVHNYSKSCYFFLCIQWYFLDNCKTVKKIKESIRLVVSKVERDESFEMVSGCN